MSKEFRIVLALVAIGVALGTFSLRFGSTAVVSTPSPEPVVWPVIKPSTPDEWSSEPVQGLRLLVTEVAIIGMVEDGKLMWAPNADGQLLERTRLDWKFGQINGVGRIVKICLQLENQGSKKTSLSQGRITVDHSGEVYETDTSTSTWSSDNIQAKGSRTGCLFLDRPVRAEITTLSITATPFRSDLSIEEPVLVIDSIPVPPVRTEAVGNQPVTTQADLSQQVAKDPTASAAPKS